MITDYELQQLLERAYREKATTLDLSFKELTQLPPEIGQLTHLKWLNLRNNKLAQLPPAIGQLTNLTGLNLGTNQLTYLPPEIGNLIHLDRFYLAYNQLKSLPPAIGRLKNLTELSLNYNQLTCLPPEIRYLVNLTKLSLSSNQLFCLLPEIRHLVNLTELELTSNQLENLPPEIGYLENLTGLSLVSNKLIDLCQEIGELKQLQRLDLQYNRLQILPVELGKLTKLTELNLNNNHLLQLPSQIGNLTNLAMLDLQYNKLSTLPEEIGNLTKLTELRLRDNHLKSLPASIGNLKKLVKLSLRNNKLTNLPTTLFQLVKFSNRLSYLDLRENLLPIPPEILSKTNEPETIINLYEQHTTGKQNSLNEAKVILVGQGGVGKTSLIRRLVYDNFDIQQEKTDGIKIQSWTVAVNNQDVKLNIWDFGGQEIYHATHQFFLTHRSLYILVFDARLDEKENQLEYWLQIIKSYGENSPIIIVGNKIDQHSLDLDRRGLQKKYKNIKKIVETSCRTGKGISEFREAIIQEIGELEHIHNVLLDSWLGVKTELENFKKQNWDYLPYNKYQRMCEERLINNPDDQRTLIRFLHDLGVVLNFQDDPRLNDTNILNPEWVTNGVYKILNDKDLIKRYQGILTLGMLERILKHSQRYPKDKHLFIIDMMRKFELCFELENAQDPSDPEYLIPDLLPKEEMENLGEWKNSLSFQYHYEVLPNSILSRFIVRMNNLIANNIYWRNGVMLAYEENLALVKADKEDKKILIWIKGNEKNRRNFLSIIRSQLDYIHKTIPGIQVKEKIALQEYPEILFDYKDLLNLEEMGDTTVPVPQLRTRVNLKQLLDGIEAEETRRIRSEKHPELSPVIVEEYQEITPKISQHKPKFIDTYLGFLLILFVGSFLGTIIYHSINLTITSINLGGIKIPGKIILLALIFLGMIAIGLIILKKWQMQLEKIKKERDFYKSLVNPDETSVNIDQDVKLN